MALLQLIGKCFYNASKGLNLTPSPEHVLRGHVYSVLPFTLCRALPSLDVDKRFIFSLLPSLSLSLTLRGWGNPDLRCDVAPVGIEPATLLSSVRRQKN